MLILIAITIRIETLRVAGSGYLTMGTCGVIKLNYCESSPEAIVIGDLFSFRRDKAPL
jgi:hypothetical protein